MMKLIKDFVVIFLIVFLAGCPKKPPKPVAVPVAPAPVAEEEPDIRGGEYKSIPELASIYFEYDKYGIVPGSAEILRKNAEYLKGNEDLEILVEGHTCECGTNEYNLSLGQKRAQAVRDYYIKLGISGGRIGTISYGEEAPVNINAGPPNTLACLSNRRAETKIR